MADRALTFEEEYEAAKAKVSPPISEENNPFAASPNYRPPPAPPPERPRWEGSVLPVSTDERGEASFDPYAGVLGGFTRPLRTFKGVAEGTIPADPRNPAYIGGMVDTALNYGPGAAASRAGPGAIRAPPREAVFQAGTDAFNTFRQSPQIFPGSDYRGFLQDTARELGSTGHRPVAAPIPNDVIAAELQRTRNYPFVTARNIDALKTQLDASNLEGRDLSGTMRAREMLYGYLGDRGDDSMRRGVANWRQASHSEEITHKGTAKSDKNIAKGEGPDLSAKQTRDSIAETLRLIREGQARGYSAAETAAMRRGLEASSDVNLAQRIGGVASGIGGKVAGGISASGVLPALAAGHPGVAATLAATAAVPAIVGAAARSYANRGARLASEEADNFLRQRSPLGQEQLATAPPLHTGFWAPGAMPGAAAGGVGRKGYNVSQNPALSAAIDARIRSRQQPDPNAPVQYRVLPDGTIEEYM